MALFSGNDAKTFAFETFLLFLLLLPAINVFLYLMEVLQIQIEAREVNLPGVLQGGLGFWEEL